MLTVGKLAAGQANYFENLARGRDEYYTKGKEAAGIWTGRGAQALGLTGEIERGQLAELLRGRHPHGGEKLPERLTKVAAYDLTFGCPKSLSVLHTISDEPVRKIIEECLDRASENALAYIEDTAAQVRRDAGGGERQKATGLIVGAYRHDSTRSLDPHLHRHHVVANFATSEKDGRCTSLHGYAFYQVALTAGYAFDSELRARIRDRLGLNGGLLSMAWPS